ncbi:MAG: exodeoxyribonuclease VII large subunit [Salibacteraceae bacterium]|jgi:exodeoxyribonuclease VII large subunit
MPKSHTLLQLSESIERVIKRTFNATYWVSAEISKLNFYPKSGHCYPELVEKLNGKIVAEIRSTIWSNTYQRLNAKFSAETGEELREGMKILFSVQVNYSPTHGISLNIRDIDPSFTLGEIAREKKMAIASLKKQGIFDANRNVPFPFFPNRIAIISVITSKGYQDFLETMKSKAFAYNYTSELFPAILQGDVAVASITEQLELIASRSAEFDVAMIIRGGGGDVGLNCYNHIEMASAVAIFPIPVITGIGHSTNETVVEMVSHLNRITPTAVADSLVDIYRNLDTLLQHANAYILDIPTQKIKPQKQKLLHTIHYLKSFAATPIHTEKMHLQRLGSSITNESDKFIARERSLLNLTLKNRLETTCKSLITKSSSRVELLEAKLRILDPQNILKRGYNITIKEGKAITNLSNLKQGDLISTQFHKGSIDSKIIKIQTNE